jgi:hypothetical protein
LPGKPPEAETADVRKEGRGQGARQGTDALPARKADGERDVLEKISEMDHADRVMAERIHAIVTASAPDLTPRTWYGMPAYAKDGTVDQADQGRRGHDRRAGEAGGGLRAIEE